MRERTERWVKRSADGLVALLLVLALFLSWRLVGPVQLTVDEPTVILAFHSLCPQCEQVAPRWKEWLDAHPDVPTLAVTHEPLEVGQAYATSKGWAVEVRTVSPHRRPFLAYRYPWVFVVDGRAEILDDHRGDSIDALRVTR